MKKLGAILIAAVVIFGCVLAAGCTSNTDQPSTTNPALTIDVVKSGSTSYNIGDTFTISFPSNPSTGYDWYPVSNEGLSVKEEFTPANTTAVGALGVKTFTYTAEKEGDNVIVLAFMSPTEEIENIYSDVMSVVKSDNNHSKGSFTVSGDLSPAAGSTVLITCNGNPTTGYQLVADKTEGLTIKEEYVAENTGLLGSGGTYKWYVTAKEPGVYIFSVKEVHAGDSVTSEKFFIPLIFTIEE